MHCPAPAMHLARRCQRRGQDAEKNHAGRGWTLPGCKRKGHCHAYRSLHVSEFVQIKQNQAEIGQRGALAEECDSMCSFIGCGRALQSEAENPLHLLHGMRTGFTLDTFSQGLTL